MAMKKLLVSTCLLFVSCLGCASNILSVREFSKVAMNASDTFSSVADDIPRSCVRRVEAGNRDNKIVVRKNDVEYDEDYLRQMSTCNKLKTSVDGIARANAVLRNYVVALGSLAADDPVTFTTDVNGLKKSLDSVEINGKKPLDKMQVDSTSNLAAYLFSAAANGYRQDKLKDAIKNHEQDLEYLIEGLIMTIDDYNAELRSEGIQVASIQGDLVRESRKPRGQRTISDAELNGRLFDTKRHLEMIEARKAAAKDCITVLGCISDSHKKLSKGSDELQSDEMLNMIRKYVEDLTPLMTNVRRAYSS